MHGAAASPVKAPAFPTRITFWANPNPGKLNANPTIRRTNQIVFFISSLL
jgi:hypothetical protein